MNTIFYHGSFGQNVAERISNHFLPDVHVSCTFWERNNAPAVDTLSRNIIFCSSSLMLRDAEQIAITAQKNHNFIALLLFERYVLVSPLIFCNKSPCFTCFSRRLQSMPPYPLTSKATSYAIELCARVPEFEYSGIHSGIAELSAALVIDQITHSKPGHAVAIDISNMNIFTANILPVHGCECRASAPAHLQDGSRFVRFVSEL